MSLSKTKYKPGTLYRKQIKLQGGFTICLPDTPVETREELVGFGISAGRTSMQTFSWEWFEVDSDDHATKIQERGELRIGVTQGLVGWELTSMEFLTDISLRICPLPAARLFGPGSFLWPPQVQWRIHILKGSHISWPPVDTLQTGMTRR